MDEKLLLDFAISVGEIMLESGAETQRVEDTMERILSTSTYNLMPETFVTPTGLFAGITGPLSGSVTKVKRIQKRSINLEKVSAANELSRDFVSGKIGLREAFDRLNEISLLPDYKLHIQLIAYTLIPFAFTLLFNGTIRDSIWAASTGFILTFVTDFLTRNKTAGFLKSFLCGLSITILVVIYYYLNMTDNYEIIIKGAIMPLVPGFAITNAARDIMYGDYISGGAMIIDAALTAVFVAAGVATGLMFLHDMFGGVFV